MGQYKSQHTGPQIDAGVDAALNPDVTVTPDSDALVTSGAVADALDNIDPTITSDTDTTLDGILVGNGSKVWTKSLDTSSLTNDADHVPVSSVVKSAIAPLDGIAVDNASVLQTVASQLKEGAITGVNTTLQTTDIPYANLFSGWAVKYGQYITIFLCDMSDNMYVNASSNYGNVWTGWKKIATNANYVHSVTPGTNVTINTGGYIQTDRIVQVSLKLTLTANVSTNAVLVSGLPHTANNVYINIGSGYNTNAYGCRTGQDKLYTNGNIPSGTELNLNFSYISL